MTMSLQTILLFFSLVVSSCAVIRTDQKNKSVQLVIQTHTPYCGGAYPTPEMAKGSYTPQSGQRYVLLKGSTYSSSSTIIQTIQLDGQGAVNMALPAGDYSLVHPDKQLTFNAFLKKYQPANANEKNSQGKECYEKWYTSPDFTFHVSSDTTLQFTQRSSCFTGTNPCLIYTGPYPP